MFVEKRGQLTAFVIVGIVIVVGIILVFVLMNASKSPEGSSTNLGEFSSVGDTIDACIDNVVLEGVYYIGLQGGYYKNAPVSKYYNYHNVPYYVIENKTYQPSLADIEAEISEYVNTYVPYCISSYENSDYEVTLTGDVVTVSSLTEHGAMIEVDMPVTISKGDKTIQVDEFSSEAYVPLGKIYSIVTEIMASQERHPNEIPLGKLIQLTNENGMEFETIYLENDDVLYSIVASENLNKPFIFVFVADYNWGGEDEE